MQSKSIHGVNGATSAVQLSHILPIPPGPLPKRTLAPVTSFDTNQVRGLSRGAVRPLPSYYVLPQQSGSYNLDSNLNKSSIGSSPAPGLPPSVHLSTSSRPTSAIRARQDAHTAVGVDQRIPAGGYSSSSSVISSSHLIKTATAMDNVADVS
jgi:hypothetical protein